MLLATLIAPFLVLVVAGIPIAIGMGLSSALFLVLEGRVPLALVAQRLFSGVDSFPLLAVPFFILSGLLMDTGGFSRRLVALAGSLVGHIRGGLALVVTVAEIFFSGISGSTTADISAIGATVIPAMRRAGYRAEQAAALVAAASAMGVLIPPCIMMVVLGSIVSISVGELFIAGLLPGLLMAAGLMVLTCVQARRGTLPAEARRARLADLLRSARESALALLLPVIIFGGILLGIATPTEIAAVAVIYAFLISVFVYRELDWPSVLRALERTVLLTGAALLLVGLATTFSWILASQQVPDDLARAMLALGRKPWLFLALSVVVFLVAGVFLEGLPAIIVLVPILLPIAETLAIDPLHYAVLAIAAVGVGIFLPPMGIGLLLSAALAGRTAGQVTRPFLPYLGVLLICLVILAYAPVVTLVLPRWLLG